MLYKVQILGNSFPIDFTVVFDFYNAGGISSLVSLTLTFVATWFNTPPRYYSKIHAIGKNPTATYRW